jgi:hypothetical protein
LSYGNQILILSHVSADHTSSIRRRYLPKKGNKIQMRK